jgi:hypothetical protein
MLHARQILRVRLEDVDRLLLHRVQPLPVWRVEGQVEEERLAGSSALEEHGVGREKVGNVPRLIEQILLIPAGVFPYR